MNKMFERFDNIPQDYIPRNTCNHECSDDIDSITVGGTVRHVFTLPFNLEEITYSVELTYYNKLHNMLLIDANRLDIICETDYTILAIELTPEETLLFEPN